MVKVLRLWRWGRRRRDDEIGDYRWRGVGGVEFGSGFNDLTERRGCGGDEREFCGGEEGGGEGERWGFWGREGKHDFFVGLGNGGR